jgi:hypothetical protein
MYVAADGTVRRVSPAVLAAVRLEDGRPVRSFPSHRGQRNYPGWYWSATMGRRVGFESWVERDHLVALDFDAAVTAVASQPFWLLWRAGDKCAGTRRTSSPAWPAAARWWWTRGRSRRTPSPQAASAGRPWRSCCSRRR